MSRVFLALLCVMLLASTVSAECAWVLWVEDIWSFKPKSGIPDKREWSLIQSEPSKRQCEKAQDVNIRNVSEPDSTLAEKIEVNENMVFKRRENVTLIHRALCLPDTVDPRGPKGK